MTKLFPIVMLKTVKRYLYALLTGEFYDPNLKPCKVCGGEACVVIGSVNSYATCGKCGMHRTPDFPFMGMAVAAWNDDYYELGKHG